MRGQIQRRRAPRLNKTGVHSARQRPLLPVVNHPRHMDGLRQIRKSNLPLFCCYTNKEPAIQRVSFWSGCARMYVLQLCANLTPRAFQFVVLLQIHPCLCIGVEVTTET